MQKSRRLTSDHRHIEMHGGNPMKKVTGICLILGLGVHVAGAAEIPNIYLHTGVSRPLAPTEFKDSYRTGVNVGVAAGWQITTFLECDMHVSYHSTTFDASNYRNTLDPETADEYVIDGGPTHLIGAMIRAKLWMPSPERSAMRSYFYAGGGLAYHSSSDIEVLGPDEQGSQDYVEPGTSGTVPGACGGLGLEYSIETTTLFLELGVFGAFTEGDATMVLPLKFGVAIK